MPRGSRSGSIIVIPAVRRKGRVVEPEKIYARRRFRDPKTGRMREKKRLAENRTDAKEKLHELLDEIRRERVEVISHSPGKTFRDLATFYEDNYLQPPKKNATGAQASRLHLRSWDKLRSRLKTLKEEFGDEPLRAIDYERIDEFRKRLIDKPIITGRPPNVRTRERSMAAVNRPLQLLRRMLNLARQQPRRWITEDPFADGDPLIRVSIETKRMRILSQAEEKKLLTEVRTAGNSGRSDARHFKSLYPAIVFAIDTAMRAGEQFSTRVSDVDLDEGFIRVSAARSKVGQERIVPISARLRADLLKLKPIKRSLRATHHRDALIFDFDKPKRSFATALRNAKIENFRWHDLRHTGTMRMLNAGVDPATAMKITGHTSWTTFMRYVNLNPELVRGVAAKLDQSRSKKKRTKAA